jgi:hypothetical protein
MRPVSCDKNRDKVPVTPMKQTGQLEEEEEPEEEEYSSIIMIDFLRCVKTSWCRKIVNVNKLC